MDSDLYLAKKLQEQFNKEGNVERYEKKTCSDEKKPSNSIVDSQWEIYDPNPDIYNLFQLFNAKYFWNQLGSVEVKWSPRMYSCAGVCTYKGRAGCIVSLSLPLLKLRPRKDLVETLLHEMIHAYLFVTDKNSEREEHGPKFHSHMFRINKAAGTNITVYHSFHDEVKHYKTHWWRCNGSCRFKHPYYGLVKRAMNRAPGPNDFWFQEHKLTCGGEFIKVKEPEGFKSRKSKKNSTVISTTVVDKENDLGKQLQTLDNYFSPSQGSKSKINNIATMDNTKLSGKLQTGGIKRGIKNNSSGLSEMESKEYGKSNNINKNVGKTKGKNSNTVGSSKDGTLMGRPKPPIGSPLVEKLGKTNNVHGFTGLTPKFTGKDKTNNTANKSGISAGIRNGSGMGFGVGMMSNRDGTLMERPRPSVSATSTNNSPKTQQSSQQTNFTPYSGEGKILDPNCKPCDINRNNSSLLKKFPVTGKKTESKANNDKYLNPPKKIKIDDNEKFLVKNEKTEEVSIKSNKTINCPVCNLELPPEKLNEHLDMCINLDSVMENISETVILDDDVNNDMMETKSNEMVNCPVCNSKIPLEKLNEHIDMCINLNAIMENICETVILDDDDSNDVIETKQFVNCPNCDQKCNLDMINQHLDQCLQTVLNLS